MGEMIRDIRKIGLLHEHAPAVPHFPGFAGHHGLAGFVGEYMGFSRFFKKF